MGTHRRQYNCHRTKARSKAQATSQTTRQHGPTAKGRRPRLTRAHQGVCRPRSHASVNTRRKCTNTYVDPLLRKRQKGLGQNSPDHKPEANEPLLRNATFSRGHVGHSEPGAGTAPKPQMGDYPRPEELVLPLPTPPQCPALDQGATPEGDYQFLGLPFVLAWSPYWSNKMSQAIVGELRKRGIVCVWYVDNILILEESEEQTR